MATAKLPEVPSDLPKASTGVRDQVYDTMEVFVGPQRWSRNPDGTPTGLLASDEILSISEGWRPVGLTASLKRIKNIPQWEKGLAKPAVKAEWDSFFALLPKWIENVYTRLDEKNKIIGADEDASDESREIKWMKGRLSDLQTAIDFAAQEAMAPPPEPKSEAPKPPAAQPASPQAAPSPQAPSSSAPPPAESPGADKGGKSGDSNWLFYAAGGVVALVLLAQMNRR
jgi:hypothetical protein